MLRRTYETLGLGVWLLATAGLACNAKTPEPTGAEQAAPVANEGAPSEAEAPLEAKSENNVAIEADVKPLSEEDKRLLAADPATLTPEERRERSYALRRKIMQNPDSAAARMLHDLEDAVRDGHIDPKGKAKGHTFSLPGTKPENARPPAGWRPPEDSDGSKAEHPEADGS